MSDPIEQKAREAWERYAEANHYDALKAESSWRYNFLAGYRAAAEEDTREVADKILRDQFEKVKTERDEALEALRELWATTPGTPYYHRAIDHAEQVLSARGQEDILNQTKKGR